MDKVWIRVDKRDRYSQETDSGWLLGSIVGKQKIKRYKDQPAMVDLMSGDTFWYENRFLVETDDGVVHEVWDSECYDLSEPLAEQHTKDIEGNK